MPDSCQQLQNCQQALPEAKRDTIFYHTGLRKCFDRHLSAENVSDLKGMTVALSVYLFFLVIGVVGGILYDRTQTGSAADEQTVSAADEQTGAVHFRYFRYITICLGFAALVANSVADLVRINYRSEIELPNQCIHPVKTTWTAQANNLCDEYYVDKNWTLSEHNTFNRAIFFTLIAAAPLLFFALCSAVYVLCTDNTTDNITGWFTRPVGLAVALILFGGLYLLLHLGVYISLGTSLLELRPKFTILDDHEDCKSYDGFTVINT